MVRFISRVMPEKQLPGDFLDPSCGEGVFIKAAILLDLVPGGLYYGIDRDPSLQVSWKADPVLSSERCRLAVDDSLLARDENRYAVVAGNPPFGLMEVKEPALYDDYQLFRLYCRQGEPPGSIPVEVLFIERFYQLLPPEGILGIILPVGIFTNNSMTHVRDWIREKMTIEGIVALETPVFRTEGTSAATFILFARRKIEDSHRQIFWGGSSRVDLTEMHRDGLDEILQAFDNRRRKLDRGMTAFFTGQEALDSPRWDPAYHHPRYHKMMKKITSGPFPMKDLGNLMDSSCILTGYKGPQEKSRGIDPIPFVTSRHIRLTGLDLSNRDSFIDRGSAPDVPRTRLQRDDVLLVRSGEGCVGRVVVAGSRDCGANIRSEIYILRPDPRQICPYFLAVFLNCFQLPLKLGDKKPHRLHFQLCRLARGVGTPNLNKEEILSIRIPVIPAQEQEKIKLLYKQVRGLYRRAVRRKSRGLSLGLPPGELSNDPGIKSREAVAEAGFRRLVSLLEDYITGEISLLPDSL